VGHFEPKFQTEGSVTNQPLLVSEYYSDCPFVRFCHKARVSQMNRQNYDS